MTHAYYVLGGATSPISRALLTHAVTVSGTVKIGNVLGYDWLCKPNPRLL